MTILDSIRQVLADDAAHEGVSHEVYLRPATVEAIAASLGLWKDQSQRRHPPSVLGLPLHVQNVGQDCIATLRAGKIISVTNLKG